MLYAMVKEMPSKAEADEEQCFSFKIFFEFTFQTVRLPSLIDIIEINQR